VVLRKRAIEYKDAGHTFKEEEEALCIEVIYKTFKNSALHVKKLLPILKNRRKNGKNM
jgi:hypothetical protein